MSEVEAVALWVGLIGGVISIVLALVAMVFTFAVDRRSSTVNEQVIKSLQKIESTVEGVAGDTRDLIKVAFDRMLPTASEVGSTVPEQPDDPDDDESVRAIAAGVAAELKAELVGPGQNQGDIEALARLNEAVERMERTMRAQLRANPVESGGSAPRRIERLLQTVASLSFDARELARQMLDEGRHLTREQYVLLRESELARPLTELRKTALIAPLRGQSPEGEEIPVYFFTPTAYEHLAPIMSLQGPSPKSSVDRVRSGLQRIGYLRTGDQTPE